MAFQTGPRFAQAGVAVQATDEGLRSYMLTVYNYMGLGLAITGLVAFIVASTPALYVPIFGSPLKWVVMLAPLGFVFFLSARIQSMSASAAQITFWAFAAVMGLSLSTALLTPTRLYVKSCLRAIRETGAVKGLAHITGGGIPGNVPRVLPAGLSAHIDAASWTLPPLFAWLREAGNVAEQEMYRVFNCGIGMVVIVSPADAERAMKSLADSGETVHRIGCIERCADGEAQTVVR